VKLPARITAEKLREFNTWFEIWNARFIPLDVPRPLPLICFQQTFVGITTTAKHRRTWLQVFKFFGYKDVALCLSVVSKEWYAIAWDNELWQHMLKQSFPEAQ
jgi:hypothetical protein